MGRGIELAAKGGLALAFAVAACSSDEGQPTGERTGSPSVAASKAAAVVTGTIVHTENAKGIVVGVRGYFDPHDTSKRENGWYPEAAEVPLVCFAIGRLGVDTDVPGPYPVQWSVWYQVSGGHNGQPQWLPEPYVWPASPLPRC